MDDASKLTDVKPATEQDLERALAQKTALLHEIDHRVKNNLQLISSLLLLQTRRTDDPQVRGALRGMLARVNAIATVHRRLFQSDDPDRFDVAQFVRDLAGDMVGASPRTDIAVHLDLERVDVPADRAAPFALIVSEYLTNALNHAFPEGQAGEITVSVRREGPTARIEITDNGVGRGTAAEKIGFGLTIVELLCRQLKAQCVTEDMKPGFRATVIAPLD